MVDRIKNLSRHPPGALKVSPNLAIFTRQKQSLNGIVSWGLAGRVESVLWQIPNFEVQVFNQAEQLFVKFRAEGSGHFLERAVQFG